MKALIERIRLNRREVNIVIEGNRIVSIGKEKDRSGEVINGKGLAIIPGFVNCHTHAAMTLLRGFADDFPLQEWLEKFIWPTEAKMKKKDVYWGSKLACLEMIKGGTTCFVDMYFYSEETARAVMESGIRAFLSEVFIGKKEQSIEKIGKKTRQLRGYGERIQPMFGPHSLYTISEENLRKIAETAEKEDVLIHFHLSETEKEVLDCIKQHGKKPVEWLDQIGFLSERVLNAHCVWLEGKEIEIMAKRKAKAVHCPVSNMKLAVGSVMPYEELKQAGVQVCLGTDGCASNNSLSMFEEMKLASLTQKNHYTNTTIMPAQEAFSIATERGAKALGLNCGRIEEGMLADFSLIDLKNVSLVPGHNLVSDIVFSASDSCIDTVFCNGEILMRNGRVEGEEEIIERAREQALNWVSR